MAQHRPREIERPAVLASMARRDADEAALDAYMAHMSAEAAHERVGWMEDDLEAIRTAMAAHAVEHGKMASGAAFLGSCAGVAALGLAVVAAFFTPAIALAVAALGAAMTLWLVSNIL